MQTSNQPGRFLMVAAAMLMAIAFNIVFFTGTLGQSMHAAWLTGTGTQGWDIVNGMTSDTAGNIYITGCNTDTVFYPANHAVSTNTRRYVFLEKYDTAGMKLWHRNIYTTGEGGGQLLTNDGNGNLIMAGYACRWLSDSKSDAGHKEMFIACLNEDGSLIWRQTLSAGNTDILTTLAIDPHSGTIQITGTFADTVSFAGLTLTSIGKQDAFILELKQDGAVNSFTALGGKGEDRIGASVYDSAGNNYLAGTFRKSLISGNIHLKRNSAAHDDGIFLIKRDSTGKCVLAQEKGKGKKVIIQKLVLASGRLFLGGSFYGMVTLENQELTPAGSEDCFVMCMDESFRKSWIRSFGGIRKDRIKDMTADHDRIVLTGSFEKGMNLGGISIAHDDTGNTIFILSLDSGGSMPWCRTLGSFSGTYPHKLIMTGSDHILMTGSFRERLNIKDKEILSNGEEDIFIARLKNCRALEPKFRSPETLCNDHQAILDAGLGFTSYTWDGGLGHDRLYKVTTAGNYPVELVSDEGCMIFDTVEVLNDNGPGVHIGNDTTITTAMKLTLKAGSGYSTYQWSNGKTDSLNVVRGVEYGPGKHIVSVWVTSANGCTYTDGMVLEITGTVNELRADVLSSACILFPNPANDRVNLVISHTLEKLIIRVTDLTGHLLDERKLSEYKAGQIVDIFMGNRPAGLYAFEISDGTTTVIKKVVLQ